LSASHYMRFFALVEHAADVVGLLAVAGSVSIVMGRTPAIFNCATAARAAGQGGTLLGEWQNCATS